MTNSIIDQNYNITTSYKTLLFFNTFRNIFPVIKVTYTRASELKFKIITWLKLK